MRLHKVIALAMLILGVTSISLAEEARLKIGFILPLSGDFAAIGADGKHGIELALKEYGAAAPFDVFYGDSRGDPTTAIAEFRKLVDTDRVHGIYAFRGPVGMALNPLSKQSRIPLLGGVGNKAFAERNEYAFQIWTPSDIEGGFIADSMLRKGHRTVAMLTAEDDWTVSVSDALRTAFTAKGGKILLDQSITAKDSDFRSLVTQLKRTNADVIFLNLGIAQIAPCLKQVREQGISKPIFSNFWSGKKEVLEAAGAAAEGLTFAEMSLTNLPKFRAAIESAFGGRATGATLSSYVATKLLLQAAGNGIDTSSALQNSLLVQSSIPLADLPLNVKNRVVDLPLALRIVAAGKVMDVKE